MNGAEVQQDLKKKVPHKTAPECCSARDIKALWLYAKAKKLGVKLYPERRKPDL